MPESASPPEQAPSEAGGSREQPAYDKRAVRRRTIKFVAVFVVTVFVLLAGYEWLQDTAVNDWYLLQVGRSTASILRLVGHSCSVANPQRFRGRETEIRAELDAWARGERLKTEPAMTAPLRDDSAAPLSAWEAWRYQAAIYRQGMADTEKELERLQADAGAAEPQRSQEIQAAQARLTAMKQRDVGPPVSFVYKPGLALNLEEARANLIRLRASSGQGQDQSAQVAQAEAEIKGLQDQITALKADGEKHRAEIEGRRFSFTLISACGGVQPMAIFVAAILAFPALWWKRLVGILAGVPVLYLVNAFRVAVLAVLGAVDETRMYFEFAHKYLWQGIYVVFVVAVWMAWVEFIVRRRA